MLWTNGSCSLCAISHVTVVLTAEGKPDQVSESTGQETAATNKWDQDELTADFGGPMDMLRSKCKILF